MPKYFTHLASNNAPKNALQTAALRMLKSQSHRLIDDADMFIHELIAATELLNNLYPRCTPLRPSTYNYGSAIAFYLGDAFTVGFKLHPVKEDADG